MGLKRGCAKSEDNLVSDEIIDRITKLQKQVNSGNAEFDSTIKDFQEAMVSLNLYCRKMA